MTDYSPSIRKLLRLSLWGFIAVALALSWWQVIAAPRLAADPNNQRQQLQLARIQPGRLLTQDGLVILDRQRTKAGWQPTYPQGRDFAHLTGYGPASGLQKGLRDELYGLGQFADPWRDLLRGEPAGNDITLTINGAAQKIAVEALGKEKGAVVALNPQTGATLVLASSPGYDPAEVTSTAEEFDLFRFDPHSPELNRATQGLYAPGSVFKIFTAATALDLGLVTPQSQFTCAGTERVAHAKVVCRKRHGRITLDEGLADSCNICFAKVGEKIGIDNFITYAKKFHLIDGADIGLASSQGRMYDFRGFKGEVALVEAAFGQGATMLSPFQIARLTAAIANKGHVLQPYMISSVQSPEKRVLLRGKARDFGQAVKPAAAAQVAGMMVDVVERGTGGVVSLSGVKVAAKTGTAQYGKGPAHGWFTCFAPADNPKVVVTVIVEGGETGSGSAGPIARQVLQALLGSK